MDTGENENIGPGSYESDWKVDAARIRRERQVYEHNIKSAMTDARVNGIFFGKQN